MTFSELSFRDISLWVLNWHCSVSLIFGWQSILSIWKCDMVWEKKCVGQIAFSMKYVTTRTMRGAWWHLQHDMSSQCGQKPPLSWFHLLLLLRSSCLCFCFWPLSRLKCYDDAPTVISEIASHCRHHHHHHHHHHGQLVPTCQNLIMVGSYQWWWYPNFIMIIMIMMTMMIS